MVGADESRTNIDGLGTARGDAVEIARGTVLAGRYEIEAAVGRGGAGLVLRARDRELRETLAIKLLRPELAHQARWTERLAREVRLARPLRHPNVCRVFDLEKADGHVFIVMELATGGSLRRELDAGALAGRPLAARLADATAVAAGLAAIHEAGLVHRDVTPQNVLRMGDGRLVVSDFGLATEISKTATSVHGGTFAYIAPEVVRDQRATFASDVYALGVVIHEIVFGARPTWSRPVGGALVAPEKGRSPSSGERLAYEVCRACTAESPANRPRTAVEVEAWLAGGRAPRRRRWRRWAAAGALAAAAVAIGASVPRRGPAAGVAGPPEGDFRRLGEPADWTETSRVLATLDGLLRCLVVLPDGRTARYVWGPPARAEDLDIPTGRRKPSPLVPAAYREGCPMVSPDGTKLAYEGYAADGRAFAFVSNRPDGSAAVPAVPIADPTISSEPKWLPDSRAFTVDVDRRHMGVYSLDTHRVTVLPDATTDPSSSSFRFVAGPLVVVAAGLEGPASTDFVGLRWPALTEDFRFRLPRVALDVASADGKSFVVAEEMERVGVMSKVDPARRTMRALGLVRGQGIHYPAFLGDSLLFASMTVGLDVWAREAGGELRQLTHDGWISSAAPCGSEIIALRRGATTPEIIRLDRTGRELRSVSQGKYNAVACAPDGRRWYHAQWHEPAGIHRCDERGCQWLGAGGIFGIAVSPDGQRLAFVRDPLTGPIVSWIPEAGGTPRDVSPTETYCAIGWSSNRGLWISRRRAGRIVWVEMDIDTVRETGRVVEGSKDCSDGTPDPQSPVSPELRVMSSHRAQIRALSTTAAGL